MEAYICEKDEPQELVLTWKSKYGNLEPGHYRVAKWFWEYRKSGNHLDFLLVGEFILK